ncbi:MAG: DUF4874 domain-containing protein [Oscillospiraceae bacterium]|jgi:hypothetical protein|nr:DUF4874 domain-containing protein [Oscillospiraceae bacterium]
MKLNKKRMFLILFSIMPLLLTASCGNHKGDINVSETQTSSPDLLTDSETSGALSPESAGADSSDNAGSVGSVPETQSTENSPNSPNPNPVSVLTAKSLPASTAENSALLNTNPDRGFRYEIHVNVGDIAVWRPNRKLMVQKAYEIIQENVRTYQNGESVTIALLYCNMYDYRAAGVDDAGVEAVDAIFEAFRESGIKVRLAFCYQQDMSDTATGVGASEEVLLRDISKLTQVVNDNRDVIYILQAGFIGAYAEWHSDNPPVDKTKILTAIADVLLPEDTYMLVRLPRWKNLLPATHPAYSRIGFSNDAFFGKLYYSTDGSGGLYGGTEQWEQCVAEGPYTPNDGELYVSSWLKANDTYPDAFKSIQALSEHRYTTFGFNHGYGDAPVKGVSSLEESAMGRWKNVAVTAELLRQKGFSHAPGWFTDKNGDAVSRNAYEYIRDYLGYKLEAKTLKVTGEAATGKDVSVSMSLVNYGFSAAFNLKSGFAILDSAGNEVVSVEAGTPSDWHPTSPSAYNNRTLLSHVITAPLKLPDTPGRYRLAFYLKNDMGQFARLGNDIGYADGYNILHTFDI